MRGVLAAHGRQVGAGVRTAVHGAHRGPRTEFAQRLARLAGDPRLDEVDDRSDERRVRPGCRDARHPDPQLVAGLLRLVVEVPDDFDVVADEPDRHDDGRLHPALGELENKVDGVTDAIDEKLDQVIEKGARKNEK